MSGLIPGSVESIMTRNVVTISPDAPLIDASRLMEERDIGSLVVVENERVVGIITERDLIKVSSGGLDARVAKVRDLMSTPVVTCPPDAAIAEAIKIMAEKNIKHLPVVKEGKLIGIISSKDITLSKMADVGLFFHSLLFGYYKAVGDVLGTGCTILAPHIVDSLIEILERTEARLLMGKSFDEIVENFTSFLTNSKLVESASLLEEEKGVFVFEVKGCSFADPTHALLPPKAVLCPLALLASAVLKKASGRDVKPSFSEYVVKGTRTRLTLA